MSYAPLRLLPPPVCCAKPSSGMESRSIARIIIFISRRLRSFVMEFLGVDAGDYTPKRCEQPSTREGLRRRLRRERRASGVGLRKLRAGRGEPKLHGLSCD